MSSLVGGSKSNLVISEGKVPVAAYQAIYHKLTSKVEKIFETFDDAYEVTINNIVHLDNMISQVIYPLKPEAFNSNCSISFKKDQKIAISSIEKLRVQNFTTERPTESLEYVFDFYTVLPVEIEDVEDVVQRFKVVLKVDQDFVEEEDGLPWVLRGVVTGRNINLRIEYSDYAVGRSLQVCVQDWIKSLPVKKVPKVVKFLDSKSEFIGYVVPYIFVMAFFLGASYRYFDRGDVLYSELMWAFGTSLALFVFGKFLCVQFFRQLILMRPLTFIKITNGDVNRCENLLKGRNRTRALAVFFGGTIVCGVLVGLFSSFLEKKLGI